MIYIDKRYYIAMFVTIVFAVFLAKIIVVGR